MNLFRWRRRVPTPALPPEPPVGVMVVEKWGMGDVYRRTASGWQLFSRYGGVWLEGFITWEHMQALGPYVVLDITAPSRPVSVEVVT